MIKPRLSEIANNYSLILCDIWGVVHNGNNIFPDALNTLLAYLDAGGDICLITNAPRRSEIIRDYLLNMGVERISAIILYHQEIVHILALFDWKPPTVSYRARKRQFLICGIRS